MDNSKLIPRGITGTIGEVGEEGSKGSFGISGPKGTAPKLVEMNGLDLSGASVGDFIFYNGNTWINSENNLNIGENNFLLEISNNGINIGPILNKSEEVAIGREVVVEKAKIVLGPIYCKNETTVLSNTDYSGATNSIILGETTKGKNDLINIESRDALISIDTSTNRIVIGKNNLPTIGLFYLEMTSKIKNSSDMVLKSGFKQLLYNPLTTEIIALE